MTGMSCAWHTTHQIFSASVVCIYVMLLCLFSDVVALVHTYARAFKTYINEWELVGGTQYIYSLAYL